MGVKTRTIANNLPTGLGQGDLVKIAAASSDTDVAQVDITLPTDYRSINLIKS